MSIDEQGHYEYGMEQCKESGGPNMNPHLRTMKQVRGRQKMTSCKFDPYQPPFLFGHTECLLKVPLVSLLPPPYYLVDVICECSWRIIHYLQNTILDLLTPLWNTCIPYQSVFLRYTTGSWIFPWYKFYTCELNILVSNCSKVVQKYDLQPEFFFVALFITFSNSAHDTYSCIGTQWKNYLNPHKRVL